MKLAERIRNVRTAYGLSQIEVANRCNMSQCSYSQIERLAGKAQFNTLEKVAEAIGVSTPFLIDLTNPDFKEVK